GRIAGRRGGQDAEGREAAGRCVRGGGSRSRPGEDVDADGRRTSRREASLRGRARSGPGEGRHPVVGTRGSEAGARWGGVVAAIGGALLGLILCLPVGSIVCDAPTGSGCAGGGTTPLGLVFETFPWWFPWLGLLLGGLAGWSIVAVARRLAG